MFTEIKLIVLICLLRICVPSYTSSSSISTCMTYESNSSYKWCRYSTLSSSGYACDASDTSTYCGGDTSYRCSSDSSYYLPQNSKKLLCPTDSFNCNTQSYYLYSSSPAQMLYSNFFGTDTFCWYKFIPYSSYMTKINIELNSLIYANAEVYYEASTNYFVYKGSLSSGDSIDIDVSYNSPVWILVVPTSNSAYVSVTGTPSGPSNYSSSDSNQMLVAIIVPTVLGGTLLIIIIIIVVICLMNRRIRMLHNQNNAATSTNYTLNYSPNNQEKYNEKYMSYYPVKMGALQFPYPPHPSKRESIYMIKSIPRKYSDTRTCYSNDPATERSTNGSRRVSTFKKQ